MMTVVSTNDLGKGGFLLQGGKESVKNLKIVKIREHIALITEMSGEV